VGVALEVGGETKWDGAQNTDRKNGAEDIRHYRDYVTEILTTRPRITCPSLVVCASKVLEVLCSVQ
jgi:hypothetical protein